MKQAVKLRMMKRHEAGERENRQKTVDSKYETRRQKEKQERNELKLRTERKRGRERKREEDEAVKKKKKREKERKKKMLAVRRGKGRRGVVTKGAAAKKAVPARTVAYPRLVGVVNTRTRSFPTGWSMSLEISRMYAEGNNISRVKYVGLEITITLCHA